MLRNRLEALNPSQFDLNSNDFYGHKSAKIPQTPNAIFNSQAVILSSGPIGRETTPIWQHWLSETEDCLSPLMWPLPVPFPLSDILFQSFFHLASRRHTDDKFHWLSPIATVKGNFLCSPLWSDCWLYIMNSVCFCHRFERWKKEIPVVAVYIETRFSHFHVDMEIF